MKQRDLGQLREGIAAWRRRPVEQIKRPTTGYSCETLVVDREIVVRLPPVAEGAFPVYDLAQQAAVQAAARAAGIPVASPVQYEPDPTWLGTPFIAMPFVDGPIPAEFTPGDRWLAQLADDDERQVHYFGRGEHRGSLLVHRIHRTAAPRPAERTHARSSVDE